MAKIPTLTEARQMVEKALQERVPEAFAQMKAQGELATFLDLQAEAMQEKMDALNDPRPVLRSDDRPLLQRAKEIAEIRDQAVERVLAEMLSTEGLHAWTNENPQT